MTKEKKLNTPWRHDKDTILDMHGEDVLPIVQIDYDEHEIDCHGWVFDEICNRVNLHDELVKVLEGILADATGNVDAPRKRVWPIRMANYRTITALLERCREEK